MERFCKKSGEAPTWDEISEQYDSEKERLQVRDYALDQRLAQAQSGPHRFSDAATKAISQGAQDVSRAESTVRRTAASLDTSEHLATIAQVRCRKMLKKPY